MKSNIKPPRLADRLLEWYCNFAAIEDLHGDIEELFYEDLKTMSPQKARFKYWRYVLSLIFSYAVKRRKQQSRFHAYAHHSFSPAMMMNYLKVGYRTLKRNKNYTIVSVSGLAIAVAVSIIVMIFVGQELNYDRYNTKSDKIFRLNYEVKFGNNHSRMATTPAVAARAMQEEFPEIASAVRFRNYGTYLVKTKEGEMNIKEQRVGWTDSTVFSIFSIPVLEGNPANALVQPASVAISLSMAKKYFGYESALGKSLILDNRYHATVTAVFEDMPEASHFHYDILISLAGDWPAAKEAQSPYFTENNFNTYILLKDHADVKTLESKLPQFIAKYTGTHDPSGDDFKKLTLMPVTDIHLHSDLSGEMESNGSIIYIYLLSSVAVLILVIACINFTNLATAQSANRAKEVGLRKTLGSQRGHLVRQFLTEAFLITMVSFTVALVLAYLLLPVFNELWGRSLKLPFFSLQFYATLVVGCLAVTLLAGLYPSLFLSAAKPVNVLKGNGSGGGSRSLLRNILVVFQFVISIVLIVGTITVTRQLDYIRNKQLGFQKEQIVLVKDAWALRPNIQVYKDQIEKNSAVHSTTVSGFVPVEGGVEFPRRDRTFWRYGTEPVTENLVSLQQWSVDVDYIKTFSMQIIQGRDFSSAFPSDSAGVILNEAAVARLGLGDDVIGKKINTFTGRKVPDFEHPRAYTVVGVVKDFHYSSMKEDIGPLALFLGRSDGFVSVRFDGGSPDEILQSLEREWKRIAPEQPFQFTFLDDEFSAMYHTEQRLGKVFGVFSAIAIAIACFGLFSLSAYAAKQRVKEFGIRKVCGASVTHIVLLLSGHFGKLIVVAYLIALPLSWFGVDWWLHHFSYKTKVGLYVYLLAGAITFIVAALTTWYHSMKAAVADPVESLKSD